MSGTYNGSHIMCAYNRTVTVPRSEESSKVMNLTSPHYVLLGRGPADDNGIYRIQFSLIQCCDLFCHESSLWLPYNIVYILASLILVFNW